MDVATVPSSFYLTPAMQHSIAEGGIIHIHSCPTAPGVWLTGMERREQVDFSFKPDTDDDIRAWVKANTPRWRKEERDHEQGLDHQTEPTPFQLELKMGLIKMPESPEVRMEKDRAFLKHYIEHDDDLAALSIRIDISYLLK